MSGDVADAKRGASARAMPVALRLAIYVGVALVLAVGSFVAVDRLIG